MLTFFCGIVTCFIWNGHVEAFSETDDMNINLTSSIITSLVEEKIKKLKQKELKYKIYQKKEEQQQQVIKKELKKKIPKESAQIVVEKVQLSGSEQQTLKSMYMQKVYTTIEGHKYYPKLEKRKNHEGFVKLGFLIKKDGGISNLSVLRKCRYKALNESALDSVTMSVPFDVFPEGLSDKEISVVIEIIYELI